VGLGLLAVGLATREQGRASLACEAKMGDSNYGQADWSWFPLGNDCTWTRQSNGFDGHRSAGWYLTAYVAVVLVAGVGVVYGIVRYARARVGLV
jgi:hypothetical protein